MKFFALSTIYVLLAILLSPVFAFGVPSFEAKALQKKHNPDGHEAQIKHLIYSNS